jgi:hypothetical protein
MNHPVHSAHLHLTGQLVAAAILLIEQGNTAAGLEVLRPLQITLEEMAEKLRRAQPLPDPRFENIGVIPFTFRK